MSRCSAADLSPECAMRARGMNECPAGRWRRLRVRPFRLTARMTAKGAWALNRPSATALMRSATVISRWNIWGRQHLQRCTEPVFCEKNMVNLVNSAQFRFVAPVGRGSPAGLQHHGRKRRIPDARRALDPCQELAGYWREMSR